MNKIFCTGLLIFVLSCTWPSAKKPVEIKNGDVSIAYNLSGKGDTAIVLVHGWCINKEYWKHQQAALSSNYTVVSLDLGGHGQSGHNRTNWTVEEYAKDVIAVINGLKLENVILVGHSMGGEIILQTALSLPGKIIGFTGIDNFKDFTTAFTPQQEQEINGFFEALKTNFDTTAAAYGKAALFPPGYTDTVSINRVITDIQRADSIVAIQSLESLMRFSLKEAGLVSQLAIPVNLIVSDYTPTNEEQLKKYCKAGYNILTIKGTGHYPMIEKPQQFTQLLQATIQQTGKSK
jgi:pimeloyl-ACP methyl ester carboxylesterase